MYRSDRGSFRDDSFETTAPVEIEDIAKQGDGIARVEGFVIFVPETKVGDQVTISVDRVMRRFAIGHKV